jgi:hypothetical protein
VPEEMFSGILEDMDKREQGEKPKLDRIGVREAAYIRLRDYMERFIMRVSAGEAQRGEEVEVLPRVIELYVELFQVERR